ncbi:MAG: dolichyl-phosphate beta-glucosyltransferase [Thermodesulfobacteriota bacterium]
MPAEISIIIPAYNEERVIGETIGEVSEYLERRGLDYELIVVSDGSTDRTMEISRKKSAENKRVKALENESRSGKGYSVKKGALAAGGDIIAFTDADLSYPIIEVEKPLKILSEKIADVAIGSRTVSGADIDVPLSPLRKLMSKVFNLFVRIIAIEGIGDTQCGFKAFSREAAREIFSRQTMSGFSFDVEIIYIAQKLGYKIIEFPIHLARYSESSSINPVSDSFFMFIDIIRIRLLDLQGRYKKE